MDEMKDRVPEEDATPETPDAAGTSRRQFLAGAGAVVAGAVLASVAGATGITAARPLKADQRGMFARPFGKGVVDLGAVSAIKVGDMVDHTKDAGLFLSRTKDGLIALSPICTHQGCEIGWYKNYKLFGCPCHGAEFSPDGDVQQGPARQPLSIYPLTLSGGHVKADTDKLTPRQTVKTSDFTPVPAATPAK
ncbi:MAG TPA: ubiquinol-cytochrome c reductase iron-sulfur subunit [Deinococcales bacterium]|nr:ubiquinol-cytochrome c reductase iron-sulfur subunit [Deinococcales bacterium]